MTNEELVQKLIELLGGKSNVRSAMNCMTRIRVYVADPSKVDEEAIKAQEGVQGVVRDKPDYLEIVVGPGKARKCVDIFAAEGISTTASNVGDWEGTKETVKAGQKQNKVQALLKTFGEIFVPLIPGVVAAGICSGICTLIAQVYPDYASNTVVGVIYNLLALINTAFLTYITAWAGYRAAEKFGGTPILGGMLGMITSLSNVDTISAYLGLYDATQPLDSILRTGRGGVLAAVIGAWMLVQIEKAVRKRMPDSLDIVLTPLVTLIIAVIPYVLIIMPVTGVISSVICSFVEFVCMNDSLVVRVLGGYIAAALFLPLVAMGMHHGLVAIYSVQLASIGYVTLYPALAMAGAGQVGAAIALHIKAKRVGNDRLCAVINGALPAGFLGVGEPLIYGVTLPMGKPFITAGLGAGFGGAFVTVMGVAATSWGPSGLLAIPVMTAGTNTAVMSMVYYVIGLVISYICGGLITYFAIKDEEVAAA